jgi:hypothetical protein
MPARRDSICRILSPKIFMGSPANITGRPVTTVEAAIAAFSAGDTILLPSEDFDLVRRVLIALGNPYAVVTETLARAKAFGRCASR